ncbi:MAG: TolC family protein [Alistipes sp.]|nr:TolC family protein [Alistipes sp.]
MNQTIRGFRVALLLFGMLWSCLSLPAQATLQACHTWATANYPLIQRYALIEHTTQYTLSNAARGWLPQGSLSLQGSYQSDVTSFPDAMRATYEAMGITLKGLDKGQYRATAEVTQRIWDGGVSHAERLLAQAEGAVQQAANAVDLYALRERVNTLFFGTLLAEAQAEQNLLKQNLLRSNLSRLKACQSNGTALACDVEALEAELLTIQQQYIGIRSTSEAYRTMLSLFTGHSIDSLSLPVPCEVPSAEVCRPELEYFQRVEDRITAQAEGVRASTRPQIGASFQGFYGNPGLNLFKDMVEGRNTWNYIAGIKMQWHFGNYYTKRNRLQQLENVRQETALQRETFLFNLRLQTQQQQQAVQQMEQQIAQDARIIALRESVRKAYEAKLENGVIETTELLREITAESAARVSAATRRIELLKQIYDLKFSVNQ